jgi:hypothetical protein
MARMVRNLAGARRLSGLSVGTHACSGGRVNYVWNHLRASLSLDYDRVCR